MPASRILASIVLGLLSWCACAGATAAKAPGVTEEAITFGQIACFSGFCQTAGTRYRTGILAAFHERNRIGGVKRREILLERQDDGYDPDLAAVGAEGFVSTGDVFAVVGGTGTATARRIAPILREAGMPFVGFISGADFLHNRTKFPNIVNLRATYGEEVRALVTYLFEYYGARRFGIVYQDDAFGQSVLVSFKETLETLGLPIMAKASYSRHTHAVQDSVFVLEKAELDAVLFATVTRPAVDAINAMRSLGHESVILLLSTINVERLQVQLDHDVRPAVLTQVIFDPTDKKAELVRRFHAALAEYNQSVPTSSATPDIYGLEGYILGRFLIEVLERMPDEPTRERFLSTAFTTGPFMLDDYPISFDGGSNSGSSYVRLIDLADENF